MEQLPADIEKEIENLPIVSFDNEDEFRQVITSSGFNRIFDYYKKNYLPEKIASQPELYQRISLYLILTNQSEEISGKIDDFIYRRPVPTIEEFLDNPRYMGLQIASLYPYWRTKLCEIFAPNSPINRVLWSGATGTGKALDVRTLIPTPTGYKKAGKIQVGDYLWGKDGKPTKVLGVYPQGELKTYRMIFDDQTEVICSGNHLWQIDYSHRKKLKKPIVLTTEQLIENGLTYQSKSESFTRYKYKIENSQAVEYPEKNYFLHPYILGTLLGDGCVSTKYKASIIINKSETEILDKISKFLPEEYYLKAYEDNPESKTTLYYFLNKNNNYREVREHKGFYRFLQENGFCLARAEDKEIPDEYMFGSIEQRLELLRGLMDTDGTIRNSSEKGKCLSTRRSEISLTTVSKKLADQISTLVRSLGGRAKVSFITADQIANYSNTLGIQQKHDRYIVYIHLLYNPFYLSRKALKYKMDKVPAKVIQSIVPTGDSRECVCFEVDSPDHLFLCNDYIVTHNTVTARKAVIYALYRLLCLKHPRSVLGVEEGSTLAVFVLSVTQKTAYQTNLEPLIRIISNMPCFQRVRNMTAFENFDLDDPRVPFPFFVDKANLTVVFKDNIIITLGSSIANTVGYDIIISAADEINELGVEEGMELLNSIDGRLDSRFKGSPFVMQNVMSSARSTASVTREYSKKWVKEPSFLYIHPMRFEVKDGIEFKNGETFPILIGNGVIPSKIISDTGELQKVKDNNYPVPSGCELVHVPTMYKNQFEAQLEQQIQDILGIDTQDTKNVFRDLTHLEDTRLNPEFSIEVNIRDNVNILDALEPYDIFEQNINGRWQFKRAPKANCYVHCDLAGSGSGGQCDASVCILHKEYKVNEVTKAKDTVYVVDLLLFINARNKVDIRAIQNFLIDLVVEKNIPVHTVTADQWQSLMFLQNLEASGCFSKVEKLSVDTKLEPYTNAATLIDQGFVKIGTCPKLKKELEALVLDKGKVARTTELKDGADAIVGAIWNAQLKYTDTPIYEYKTSTLVQASVEENYENLIDVQSEELDDL